MADLADGESIEVKGSAAKPYMVKNVGGVYSCSCAAWRNQSLPIERRTCKHIRRLRGEEAERERVGGELPPKPAGEKKEAAGPDGILPGAAPQPGLCPAGGGVDRAGSAGRCVD